MFKVISDIMAHCYDMWNTIISPVNFCNAMKVNWALMFIISNHYGIKCVSNLLQLEPCSEKFKVISDVLANCYDVWNTIINETNFCNAKENELCIVVYHKQSLWNKMC